jgi:tetratricopeptide (TPR) repeat protein
MFTVLALVAIGRPETWALGEGEPEDPHRRALAAEEQRFKRTVELADTYSRLGRAEEARRLYEEALVIRDDDVDVMDALLVELRRLGDYRSQLPLYRRLVSVRPGDARLHMDMGECLWRLKQTEEACTLWNDVLRRFVGDPAVYDDLIDFYTSEGRFEDARDVLRQRRERFRRFEEEGEVLLAEARLAIASGKPEEALPLLLHALELEISEEDCRRAEFLLFHFALETGKTGVVLQKLTERLDTVDARLAGRFLDLAGKAAERKEFASAIRWAQRALPLLKTPAREAEVNSLIADWRGKTVNPPR